jgi:plasmid stability protein
MAQILVRKLDEKVVERLKKRANDNGRSLEAEVRLILEEAAKSSQVDMETARKRIEELRERLKGREFPDSVELIREGRDR